MMTATKENNPASQQVVTLQNLIDFKNKIILEVKKSISQNNGQSVRKWLKTYEVREILGVSVTTLLTLRINSIMPFTKMGGVLYYDYNDILMVMEKLKNNKGFLPDEKPSYQHLRD